MCLDVGNVYLETPLDRYDYMKIPIALFPSWIKKKYNQDEHTNNWFVYVEIRKAIYGLPQGEYSANKRLWENLKPNGYYEVSHTPGLWRHKRRPIQFSLVCDDFGVKYAGKEHAEHLIQSLKAHHKSITTDWKGNLHVGIQLDWNYENWWLNTSMPGYINKLRQHFDH
jgi:hypothetical protein